VGRVGFDAVPPPGIGAACDDALPAPPVKNFVATTITDSVAIGAGDSILFQRAGADVALDRFTAASWATYGYILEVDSTEPKDPDFTIGAAITRSIFTDGPTGFYVGTTTYLTAFVHDHDDLFAVPTTDLGYTTPDATDVAIDPQFDEATHGLGAYLIRPAVGGAEVLYRYVDGALTAIPLWPWPMEARIARELGISPTWEIGGGIWRAPPPVGGCAP
jgi:hypothetical protein